MEQKAENLRAAAPTIAPEPASVHTNCRTLDVTEFLLGRVSMDEVCQFCVLDVLAPLQPWQMSIYVVGTDSLFRLVGSFGKGPGQDALHQHSCLDDLAPNRGSHHDMATSIPHVAGTFLDAGVTAPDLEDDYQALWPLTAAHRLVGVMHVRFHAPPGANVVSDALSAIAGPITLALELQDRSDHVWTHHVEDREPTPAQSLVHPSLAPRQAQSTPGSRNLSVVRTLPCDPSPAIPPDPTTGAELTARQRNVLALMADGMTNGQIARALAFSESTVRQDTMAIYRILEVRGRAEAIDVGRCLGLIPAPTAT